MRNRAKIAFLYLVVPVLLAPISRAQNKNVTMSGLVRDSDTQKPIEGATVTVIGNRAKSGEVTDRRGVFILMFVPGVDEGTPIQIRAEKQGYKPYQELVTLSSTLPQLIFLEPMRSSSTLASPPTTASQEHKPGPLGSVAGASTVPSPTQPHEPGADAAQAPKPFAFTEALPDKVTLLIDNGSNIHMAILMQSSAIEKEPYTGSLVLDDERPIAAYIENNVFYVDAAVLDLLGHTVVRIKKNQVEVMPPGWDMNSSANAIEVVDAQAVPIFQMVRKRTDLIQVAGLFVSSKGSQFDARPPRALFKYPSWKFPGQYASQEIQGPGRFFSPEALRKMTNTEIKSGTQFLCNKIGTMAKQLDDTYNAINENYRQQVISAKSDEQIKQYYSKREADVNELYSSLGKEFDEQYRQDANLLRAEVSRRLEADPGYVLGEHTPVPPLLASGSPAGANPFTDVCDYLQVLVSRLHRSATGIPAVLPTETSRLPTSSCTLNPPELFFLTIPTN